MKVLVVFTSLLAVTLASYYPINIPVIGHTGVPLESAEIVHARQAHLSHVAAVKSRQGGWGWGWGGLQAGGGYGHITLGHGGVPIDTPEVQAARAAHFAAYNKAASAAAFNGGENYHLRKRRGIFGYAAPIVLGHNGTPLDTPEVQAARAEHFAAHAKAGSGLVGAYGGASYGAQSYPQLAHNGQPLETPEVAALRAQHLSAHAEARSRIAAGGSYAGGYEGGYERGYEGVASSGHGVYHGPIHIPVIGHNGVPVDTHEVQAARQKHLQALAEASSKGSYQGEQYQHFEKTF